MAGAGDGHEFEGLPGFLQRGNDLRGARGIDIGVEFADDEEQMALQLMRVLFVRAFYIRLIHRPAHPLFVPPDFVHPVVMTAAISHGHLVKIVMIEQRTHRVLSASAAAVDADAGEVHPRACFRSFGDPELPIWEAGVLQILPAHIVECLAAMIRAHAIEFDDDEALFGDLVHAELPVKILRSEGSMRSGIDVLDDGVFSRWIKLRWRDDDAVDVCYTISPLRHEALRHRPAGGEQRGGVGLLYFAHETAIAAAAQLGDGRVIGTRPSVDEKVALG